MSKISYLIGGFLFILIIYSCSYKTSDLSSGRRKPPPIDWTPPGYDTLPIDTVFVDYEKICFPPINFCFDSFDLITYSYIPEGTDYANFKKPQIFYNTKTIDIYPLDLKIASDSQIINKFLKLLEIEDAFYANIVYKELPRKMFDSVQLKTSYFFDYSKKNKIHAIDTLNYCFISDEKKGYLDVIIELNMEISGDDNLNQLVLTRSRILNTDSVIYQYKSKNEHCKNLKFDMKFIVLDKKYFNRKDYAHRYMYLNHLKR